MLKIGDQVQIRSITWYVRNHDLKGNCHMPSGLLYFSSDHAKYLGRKAHVVAIETGYIYRIDIDNGKLPWSDDMFEQTCMDEQSRLEQLFNFHMKQVERIKQETFAREISYKSHPIFKTIGGGFPCRTTETKIGLVGHDSLTIKNLKL